MHRPYNLHTTRLTPESFIEAASALRAVSPEALRIVVDELRASIPALASKPRLPVEDALPQLIEQLARVMEQGTEALHQLDEKTASHASHRQEQDLDLDQMLLEYQMLRDILARLLVTELGRELSPEEAARFHAALDLSLRGAAAVFVEQQKEKLQAEAAAMAKYLAFLSHDLRGNLNGAMLMIEVLRRDLQHDQRFAESVHDLDAMRQSMLELVGTMDRFLQAERLRQGRVEVSLQNVDIGEFLEEQRRAIVRQVRSAADKIEVEVEAGLKIVTDREMLGLIVQNTLSNCVKYASDGVVQLRGVSPRDGTNAVCRIEVADSGPGMDPDLKDRLFEPFVRGVDTGRQGTGLGLFIAKQAADLLGATLAVESERGKGTRFLIDLPSVAFPDSAADGASRRH